MKKSNHSPVSSADQSVSRPAGGTVNSMRQGHGSESLGALRCALAGDGRCSPGLSNLRGIEWVLHHHNAGMVCSNRYTLQVSPALKWAPSHYANRKEHIVTLNKDAEGVTIKNIFCSLFLFLPLSLYLSQPPSSPPPSPSHTNGKSRLPLLLLMKSFPHFFLKRLVQYQ